MVDYYAAATATVALLWTIFQQYKLSKICYECPLRKEMTLSDAEYRESIQK